jgi:hypothetical protein
MATTNQEVIDRARTGIIDAYKRRVTDATFLSYLKDFVLWLYSNRPDWFIGQFSAIPTVTLVTGTYPLEDRTIPMAELYLVARAESPLNQEAAQERFKTSLALLEKAAHG